MTQNNKTGFGDEMMLLVLLSSGPSETTGPVHSSCSV